MDVILERKTTFVVARIQGDFREVEIFGVSPIGSVKFPLRDLRALMQELQDALAWLGD